MYDSYVYVLRCAQNKYYVGLTNNFAKRMYYHFTVGNSTKWTAQYPAVKLIRVFKIRASRSHAVRFEHAITLLFALRHGLENVHGGKLCIFNYRAFIAKKLTATNSAV